MQYILATLIAILIVTVFMTISRWNYEMKTRNRIAYMLDRFVYRGS